ncbi:MAG TPA: peptide chain release factor N(5)-glutamine methyltransferase [Cyclobacteriaceae bacterium]|nr:peptide chain release factor N(5)-glutamine methyltransferase [Cyclobacteriaceae bacterium]
MTNSKILFQELVAAISINTPRDEIESIVYLFMEKSLGISKSNVITESSVQPKTSSDQQIDEFISRINAHEPVQYVLGESEFYGRPFEVDRNVLIPRPETEELVRDVIRFSEQQNRPLRILDIGTGSGCISVTIKLEIAQSEVFATDISKEALAVAQRNAHTLNADVTFFHNDILTEEIPVKELDITVSNPPYVTLHEKLQMKENVLHFEPHLALFVPDNDSLLFYRHILMKSKKAMKRGGLLIVEINELYGESVATLFNEAGLTSIEIVKDIFGKDRIVKGIVS